MTQLFLTSTLHPSEFIFQNPNLKALYTFPTFSYHQNIYFSVSLSHLNPDIYLAPIIIALLRGVFLFS